MERQVLSLLRDQHGAFISGELISRQLGVSRTMIWKNIQSLRKQGFHIDSSANKGYKLLRGPEKVIGIDIEAGLGTKIMGRSVLSFDKVPSTIDVAGSLAAEGADEGTVVVAEAQTGGRGRLGRKWSSPAGVGIWTSIILRPSIPPHDAPKLTLLTAVAVTRVLQNLYQIEARIKWPNDVVLGKKKICGALTELVAEQDAVRYAIISFGLNVNQTRSQFPAEVVDMATSMRIETGRRQERPQVFRQILCELDDIYAGFKEDAGAAVLKQWRALSCTLGKKVTIRLRDESVEGLARDLADDGSLIIETETGLTRQISYGDVTILR